MKKLNKINLELNKEVISSLSGNEMNHAKGGAVSDVPFNCELPYSQNINNCDPRPVTINGITCVANLCQPQTQTCQERNTCMICWEETVGINSCVFCISG